MIQAPFLLYIGKATDPISIKTSRGLAVFRPEDCIGELRDESSPLTLGLPALTLKEARARGARTLILGVANAGGIMTPDMIADAVKAARLGFNLASGLHQRLRDVPAIVDAACEAQVKLFDVRDPPSQISIGNGKPRLGKRILTVGTDCSVGKMYTSLALWRELEARGIKADFRATGQTGILIAGSGIPLDAVVADFIAGAIEDISPARHDGGWDVIEGQGSLFHPSFAGVSTGLLHGAQPDVIVMCHEPERPYMRGLPHFQLPRLEDCIAANLDVARLTNPNVQIAGIALNTSKMDRADADQVCAQTSETFGLPCSDPFSMGVNSIVDRILTCTTASKSVANISD